MDFRDERKYLGNVRQLFRVDEYRKTGGRGDGMRVVEVKNGRDLCFTSVTDRCMDIHYLHYRGYNFGFLTGTGDVGPAYYDDKEKGWLRSFTAGFLSTCGLRNIGNACDFEGRHHGLHGRIGSAPAEYSAVCLEDGSDKDPGAEISGIMRESLPSGDTLTLSRKITTAYRDKRIFIHDTVTNEGYEKTLHMILYHFNIGYPLLSEKSLLIIPNREIRGMDTLSQKHIEKWNKLTPPETGAPGLCFYHKLKTDSEGKTFAGVYNPDLEVGVAVRFDSRVLDHFVQWYQMASGYYTTGLEPCNVTLGGIQENIDNGSAKFLEARQSIRYDLTIQLLEGRGDYNTLVDERESYTSA